MQILKPEEVQSTYFTKLNKWLFKGVYREKFNFKPNHATVYSYYQDRFAGTSKTDTKGNKYVVYADASLGDDINLDEKTVRRTRDRLEEAGLIYVERQGFDPQTGRRKANHIYLLKPEIDVADLCKSPTDKKSDGEILSKTTRQSASKQDLQVSYQVDLPPDKMSQESDQRVNRYIDKDNIHLNLIINKFKKAGLPMIYTNKIAKQQAKQLATLIAKIKDPKIVDKLVERTVNHANIKDAPNFLIKCLQNELDRKSDEKTGKTKKAVRKPKYAIKKHVEKGTDWSKKKAKVDPNFDPEEIRNFFVKFEKDHGM